MRPSAAKIIDILNNPISTDVVWSRGRFAGRHTAEYCHVHVSRRSRLVTAVRPRLLGVHDHPAAVLSSTTPLASVVGDRPEGFTASSKEDREPGSTDAGCPPWYSAPQVLRSASLFYRADLYMEPWVPHTNMGRRRLGNDSRVPLARTWTAGCVNTYRRTCAP
ncbi:hypothetical protein ONE63_001086 [Megalurothrips usitatus]|uniref:Uncharacterized protein n=1 Tax=Megalurothrips usitatus TaxID=439358 RepID=A0AAV7XFD9_9NEOP|nr:hypothetical protein ONE63_001086 [Megalurothrips usitatus]